MTDIVDVAANLQDEHVSRILSRIDPTIPAGVAGVCDECGETMPRLVGGRCGYCRDGRPHPFERARGGSAPDLPPPPPKEQPVMPNPANTRTVTFVARGAILEEINRRTADGQSVASVVQALAEAGLAPAVAVSMPAALSVYPELSNVSLLDLLDELRRRAEDTTRSAELEARAIAAETKLANLRTAILGDVA